MLPKLNRNTSLMNPSNNGVSPYMGYHSLSTNGQLQFIRHIISCEDSLNIIEWLLGMESSPLKLFSKAKQAINSIYHEFDSFIAEIYTFLDCKFEERNFFSIIKT